MPEGLEGGRGYPSSYAQFVAWFQSDAACLDYLDWTRWPGAFRCPECGARGYKLGDGCYECGECHRRTSVTAGTIFVRTRLPLTIWFHAIWLFVGNKDGISALRLQSKLELGSYHTAWAMLAKTRSTLVNPGRDLLKGLVEVDESYYGGFSPGSPGRGQAANKVPVIIAVERRDPKGFGRCRLQVARNVRTDTLRQFLIDNVEPGSTVVTDGNTAYRRATQGVYTHRSQVSPATEAHIWMPAVCRAAALSKRWLLSTHQGSVKRSHLQLYLDEYTFRFNRRKSRSRGLLFYRLLGLALEHEPVRYGDLIVKPRPDPENPPPPVPAQRRRAPSLALPAATRLWRAA